MTAHRTEAAQARCGEQHCTFCGQCRSTTRDGLGWAAELDYYGCGWFCSWQCRDNGLDRWGGRAIIFDKQPDGSFTKRYLTEARAGSHPGGAA